MKHIDKTKLILMMIKNSDNLLGKEEYLKEPRRGLQQAQISAQTKDKNLAGYLYAETYYEMEIYAYMPDGHVEKRMMQDKLKKKSQDILVPAYDNLKSKLTAKKALYYKLAVGPDDAHSLREESFREQIALETDITMHPDTKEFLIYEESEEKENYTSLNPIERVSIYTLALKNLEEIFAVLSLNFNKDDITDDPVSMAELAKKMPTIILN